MAFTRAFPWSGHVVYLHADRGASPYWVATIDGVDVFTGVEDRGVDNVDEVTTIVQRWITEGSIPMGRR